MKNLVLWLIRVFKLDIPTEKIVEKVVEKEVYLPKYGVIDGDIIINGNVNVEGNMTVKGCLTIVSKEV